MSLPPSERFTHLVDVDHPGMVPLVEAALRRAGIPYHSGLQSVPTPRIVLSVPASRLEEARLTVVRELTRQEPARPQGADEAIPYDQVEESADESEPEEKDEDATFPAGPIAAAGALFLLHFAIVLLLVGPVPSIHHLIALGGLVTGGTLREPFRLVTSLFLHADPSHAFWNGVSLLAFAVPLIVRHGYLRTSGIYLAAGIGGCLAALSTTTAGTVTIGSSGAVAGLFGAWVADALLQARQERLSRRARIRAMGIALLVLPSLLQPATPSGDAISVASHLGGLAAGLVLGWVLARRT